MLIGQLIFHFTFYKYHLSFKISTVSKYGNEKMSVVLSHH